MGNYYAWKNNNWLHNHSCSRKNKLPWTLWRVGFTKVDTTGRCFLFPSSIRSVRQFSYIVIQFLDVLFLKTSWLGNRMNGILPYLILMIWTGVRKMYWTFTRSKGRLYRAYFLVDKNDVLYCTVCTHKATNDNIKSLSCWLDSLKLTMIANSEGKKSRS